MVQSFNSNALGYLVRVLRNKSLVIPHFSTRDISYISFTNLKKAGIKGIVFDKDNTLTAPYAPQIYPTLQTAYESCLETFGPNRVCIFSNSAGSSDDKDFLEAEKISRDLRVHVIRHVEKKPGGAEDVLAYLKCEPHEVAAIGDRYFTDILFGNLHGMLTFYTAPLTDVGDNSVVKLLRPYEHGIVQRWIAQNILPPAHPFAQNPDFVIEPNIPEKT
eukprot:Phypoly_transcript_15756.p1 GENE.Phypoly_transcript_15756~~Phypoly_transcript_15756.p1  ORF type:complete len:217 (+),score=26.30 Phypoly_transcript_15756:80-730(+)